MHIAQQSLEDRLAADIQAHAGSKSQNKCAKFVRQSIERVIGSFPYISSFRYCLQISFIYKTIDVKLKKKDYARMYGPSLEEAGFAMIPNETPLRPGDVRIIQPIDGRSAGHMQMYTHNGWMSDFRQRDEWPGPAYRKNQPPYKTYRFQQKIREYGIFKIAFFQSRSRP